MKKASVSKNYIYNLIYQVLAVIIPIILKPYLSRVLEPDGMGRFSFTNTFMTYFSYFALLGVQLYGTKVISLAQDDPYKLKKTFWEILGLKTITSVIAITLYFTFMPPLIGYELIYFHGIWLFVNLIDITWYFTGSERFKSIVIRNSIIKILTVVSIFVFVRTKEDIYIYATILAVAELFGQLILWFSLRKETVVKDVKSLKGDFHPSIHIKGTLTLFLPQAIILLYTSLNTTMIGFMAGQEQVGYFDSGAMIVNTMLLVATSLAMVMVPRISKLNEEGDKKKITDLLNKSIHVTTYLAYPMMFGLIVLSHIFVPWFFGMDYLPVVDILALYSIKISLVVISNVI